MQIVMDIPDKVYGLLKYFEKAMGFADKEQDDDDVKTALIRAVIKGTPLPKGHGRLIDTDALEPDRCGEWNGLYVTEDTYKQSTIDNAPTIIEADKAESEVKE